MTADDRADDYYTRWAALYDQVARRTPGITALRRAVIRALNPPSGGIVVEMGCGPGPNFPSMRKAVGAEGVVVGIDVACGALSRAARMVDRRGWETVHPIRGDATRPPIVDADAVLATFVVGMFEDPAGVVDEWCELVGPGGRIGLLHFSRSDRWHAPLSNAALDLLVTISTPGAIRYRRGRSRRLDRRVTAGTNRLTERCEDVETTRAWGGLIRIDSGTVTDDSATP